MLGNLKKIRHLALAGVAMVVGVVLTYFTGCAGGSQPSGGAALRGGDSEDGGPEARPTNLGGGAGFDMPLPSALLKEISLTDTDRFTTGASFEAESPFSYNRVAAADDTALFFPQWDPATSPDLGDTAYCIYQFSLEGYDGESTLELSWQDPPAEWSNLWVGFSHWEQNTWEWYRWPAAPALAFPTIAPYIAENGALLTAVILMGEDEQVLEWVRVGSTIPPTAVFIADPTQGDAPLTVNFDASGSYDLDGSVVKYDFDFDEGAGWQDYGTTTTAQHTYGTLGTYYPKMRVTDEEGATDVAQVGLYMGAAQGDWWMFGREPTHNRRSPFTGPETPGLKWSYTTGDQIWSSPAIASDGTIYVGSFDDKLYAINPDGSLKWSYTTGNDILCSPAIASDGTIYIGSRDNKLYAINPDGSLKWSYTAGGYVYSPPAIGADGTIYAGSGDNKLYAINPDGSLKWSYTTDHIVVSSSAIGADGTIYVGSFDGKLYAINPDGELNWSYTTGDLVYSSPAIGADGTIYVGSSDDKLYAINPDGTMKWSYTTGGWVWSSPAIGADGTIYVGSLDNKLYAINSDGTLKWSYTTNYSVHSSPAIGADGAIFVGSWDLNLYAINPDGSFKWSYATGGGIDSSPAIGADGTIYVGSNDGKLYAIGPGEGL